MKKTVFLILALAALMILLCAQAAAEMVSDFSRCGGFTYRVQEDGSAMLIWYTGPEGEVVIPNTLDGHPVMGVFTNPFRLGSVDYRVMDCAVSVADDHPYLSAIDGVLYGKTDRRLIYCPPFREGEFIIPQGITTIGAFAFADCTGLTAVSIPDSVTSIESGAFALCTGLTAVSIPDGVTSIWTYVFAECTGLTAVSIPDSVTSIEDCAFEGCTGLTAVSIPDSVTRIGSGAFASCASLTQFGISMEHPVYEHIDGVLFHRESHALVCYPAGRNAAEYVIPDHVKRIGASAFEGCTGLTAVSIPDSVTSIGVSAFRGCIGLTAVSIPDGVTSIENSAFSGCTGLTSVSIPDGVTSIENSAFGGCTGLTSVSIPGSVTSIGGSAFFGCTGLTAVSIPDSVTTIGREAFFGCTGLSAVSIPASVTYIGKEAFHTFNEETQTNDPLTSVVFTVPRDSYAERYCRKNGFTFVCPDFT